MVTLIMDIILIVLAVIDMIPGISLAYFCASTVEKLTGGSSRQPQLVMIPVFTNAEGGRVLTDAEREEAINIIENGIPEKQQGEGKVQFGQPVFLGSNAQQSDSVEFIPRLPTKVTRTCSMKRMEEEKCRLVAEEEEKQRKEEEKLKKAEEKKKAEEEKKQRKIEEKQKKAEEKQKKEEENKRKAEEKKQKKEEEKQRKEEEKKRKAEEAKKKKGKGEDENDVPVAAPVEADVIVAEDEARVESQPPTTDTDAGDAAKVTEDETSQPAAAADDTENPPEASPDHEDASNEPPNEKSVTFAEPVTVTETEPAAATEEPAPVTETEPEPVTATETEPLVPEGGGESVGEAEGGIDNPAVEA